MTEQAKVPAIRFAGFTDPWEQRKLENLASFGGGHTPSMADASNYVDGKILWVTSQDVKQHYIENTTTMISEKGAATLTLYPSDSIVIVARSGILRHTIPVAKLRKPATVNQDIKVIQTVDSCDSSWLLQYFIASNKTLLREYGKTGTTVESIDFAKMKSTALMVPYIEEQQAIGSFFSRLDNLITLHQRKYDKLVIFKKSMLEKMFPKDGESVPEIRFAGFTDPWEQRKLENLASFGGGHTPSMADASNYVDGKILWVTSQDVKQHYIENTTTMISEKGAATLTLYPSDSIVIVARSGILRHTIPVAKLRKPATVNQDIKVIQTVDSCDSSWLLQYFIASNKTLLREYGKTGTTVESIDFAKMKSTALMVPYIEEQQAIGSFFSRLDNLITLHQRKYDKLVIFKKSMLEKMFPKDGESVPEIRFAGFTDPWEQRKLGDIAERVTRKNENNESDLPLTISAQHGLIDQRLFFNAQVASRDMSGYYLLRQGEFAYNKSTSADSPWGAIKRLTRYEKGCVSTLYICFALLNANPDYLVTYYETNRWHKAVQMIAAEGARNHGLLNIAPDDFFDTMVSLPESQAEQQTIGAFFSRLDSLITLHQRKLELLQDIKKSLLDKMFV